MGDAQGRPTIPGSTSESSLTNASGCESGVYANLPQTWRIVKSVSMKNRLTKFSIFFVALLLALPAVGCQTATAQEDRPQVYVAQIDGKIDGDTADYVGRVISEAEESNAEAMVLEIDTPGGDLPSTKEIVQAESNAEKTPVFTYVTPRGADAASAGSIVVMASDVAAMAPQSSIGATTPISGLGRDLTGDLGQKVLNNTVSLITGLAAAHDRNEEWAEAAVREAASANAAEALDMNIVEYVEPDLRSVLKAADGEEIQPKGITLDTADAELIQKPLNFEERLGFSTWWVIVPAILLVLFLIGLTFAIVRTSRLGISTGREGMIGEVGTVRQTIDENGGSVFVHGELWSAIPEDKDAPPIERGAEVKIADFRRTSIVVRRAE